MVPSLSIDCRNHALRGRHRISVVRFLFMTCCWVPIASAADVVFPGVSWQSKQPHELGLDDARLEAVAAALGSRGCAIKDGYVVKTWGSQDQIGDLFSSAKPVLSTLLMFAVQEGKVKSFDQLGTVAEGAHDDAATFGKHDQWLRAAGSPRRGLGLQRLCHSALPEDSV
jgi:hypothetical protein